MALKLYAGPTFEPVTLSEAKLHCRVSVNADDQLITALIQAAREQVETMTRRALCEQTWDLFLDDWPSGNVLVMPLPPLASVTSITCFDALDTAYTISADRYYVDTVSEPGRIVFKGDYSWPPVALRSINSVRVRYVAGWSTRTLIPQQIKQAVLLLIGHWYENRELVITSGAVPKEISMTVEALLATHRVYRWM